MLDTQDNIDTCKHRNSGQNNHLGMIVYTFPKGSITYDNAHSTNLFIGIPSGNEFLATSFMASSYTALAF